MVRIKLPWIKINISFWFAIMFAAVYALGEPESAMSFFAAAALHEFGHMFFMLLVGDRVEEIALCFGRIEIKRREDCEIRARALMLVYLGGVIFNALGAAAALGLGNSAFLYANTALLIFNILPCRSFDGGRCCELIMEIGRLPPDVVARKTDKVSFVFGCALASAGLCCFVFGLGYAPAGLSLIFAGARACFIKHRCP